MVKKILITGGSGQLGSELKDIFATKSYEVIFLDRKELPLDQTQKIQDILGMYKPHYIIHCAAYTAVDKAETEIELALKVNYLASAEIAKYCNQYGTKLIAISTDYVFDGNSSVPLKEDALVKPINIYGETKLKAEQAIQTIFPDAIIIRTSWVYSTYGHNFVKTMIRLMKEREEIFVINDQVGSPTYALDLARFIVDIIDRKKWESGLYHFSNEGEISWFEFATAIKELKGIDCKINAIPTEAYPSSARRPRFSLLDKTKIKDVFAVNVPFWKDSLKEMLTKI